LISNRLLLICALAVSASGSLRAQALFPKPVKVLGDPSFIGTASSPTAIEGNGPNVVEGREFSTPLGIALDNSVSPPNIYVADSGNNRVLGFHYTTQLTPGAMADVILGQSDRFGNLAGGPGSTRPSGGMNQPTAIAVDVNGNVYVADTGNNRILRFPKPFSQPAGATQLPDLVIGQSSFSTSTANSGGIGAKTLSLTSSTSFRNGLAFDSGGNLFVTDTGNNRILRFPATALKTGTNGPAADLVLGEPDFVTTTAATSAVSKTGLSLPQALSFDAGGRLLVADTIGRILVFPPALAANGTPALRILGLDQNNTSNLQATQTQVARPLGVIGTSSGIVVSDTYNSRVLLFPLFEMWPAESAQFSPSATEVVGQTSYTSFTPNQGMGDASASSLNIPTDVAASATELFVVDFQNSRVLVFSFSTTIGASASRVIGQLDFPYFAPNLIEGKEFNFTNSASTAVLDQSVSPPILYVADTVNNRVLGYKNFNSIGIGLQKADLVIGQPDFYRDQINYPTNMASMPNSQGLNNPTSLAVDSAGNLYVADTGNSRILRFPAPFASGTTALETADLVIGQTSFTSQVTDPTPQTLSSPQGIALSLAAVNAAGTTGFLIVSDAATNRVLFFPKPFSIGMSATKVLGVSSLNSAGTAGSGASQFNSPHGVAVDPTDIVMVADSSNKRVQIFGTASAVNTNDTATLSLKSGLSQPLSIATSPSGFWVADPALNGLVHFPAVSQLAIKNNASDASMVARGPLSAFVDSYLNLLVCDSANRVLYFAPQMVTESAASYSSRALTPGMLATLFPSIPTNVIATGTALETAFPLPTTLSDTQVLVNGTPAPLFFVSPGQINFELSNSLSTGGIASIQTVRPSTGQIYGSAEIQLASADPALFTFNGTGGGQAAASNFVDFSNNSSSNPVARGQTIILYGTGLGPVGTPPPDGQAVTGPVPGLATPQILLGASATAFVDPSYITYSGLAPTDAGVWQINLTIPPTAPTGGSVPIRIFLNSIPSIDPNQSGATTTTIAIK
jgi:uncharacterized protein (TIGR03437 family)